MTRATDVETLKAFRMPKAPKITGRLPAITNSFANSIVPKVKPTADEVRQALRTLGMGPKRVRCSYCGDPASEWDHLEATIRDRRPTGYITEIRNLVPACGKCNQSKGNQPWEIWMTGPAAQSPASRGIADLDKRIERLHAFVAWAQAGRIELEEIVGPELWDEYYEHLERIETALRDAQAFSDQVRDRVAEAYQTSTSG